MIQESQMRVIDPTLSIRYPSAYPLRPPNEADVFYRRYRKEYYPNDGVVSLNGPDWHKLRMQLTPPLTRKVVPCSVPEY